MFPQDPIANIHIYITCYKYDLELTKACVASIRTWYQDVPITLVPDRSKGWFCTKDMERYFNVGVLNSPRSCYGYGLGHLEPMLLGSNGNHEQRNLIMDSDIIFAGKVLEKIAAIQSDFVVCGSPPANFTESVFKAYYFDYKMVQDLDKDFQYPDIVFSGGHFVCPPGVVQLADIVPFVNWDATPVTLKQPRVFQSGDQGFLNYLVSKLVQTGRATMQSVNFVHWPNHAVKYSSSEVGSFIAGERPTLIHWAGLQHPRFECMPLGSVIRHFWNEFYARIPGGAAIKYPKLFKHYYYNYPKKIRRDVTRSDFYGFAAKLKKKILTRAQV